MTGILTKRDSQSTSAATPTGLPSDPPQVLPDSAVSPEALPTEAEVMAEDIESDAVDSDEVGEDRERRVREAA